MKYCGKCGAENPDTDLFCWKCGNRLHDEPAVEPKVEEEPTGIKAEPAAEATEPEQVKATTANEGDADGMFSWTAPPKQSANTGSVPHGTSNSSPDPSFSSLSEKNKMRYAIIGVWLVSFLLVVYMLFVMNIHFESTDDYKLFSADNTIYGANSDGWINGDPILIWLSIVMAFIYLLFPVWGVIVILYSILFPVILYGVEFHVPVIGNSFPVAMSADSSSVAISVAIVIVISVLFVIEIHLCNQYNIMTGNRDNQSGIFAPWRF